MKNPKYPVQKFFPLLRSTWTDHLPFYNAPQFLDFHKKGSRIKSRTHPEKMYQKIKEGKKSTPSRKPKTAKKVQRAFIKSEKRSRKKLKRVLTTTGLGHLDSKKYMRKN